LSRCRRSWTRPSSGSSPPSPTWSRPRRGSRSSRARTTPRIRQADLKLTLAKLALDQWDLGEKVQKLKDIELALDKTDKDLVRLKEKYAQSQNLYSEGFLSKDELQRDEIALREAQAAREKAILDNDTYNKYQLPKDREQKQSDVREAQAELERTKQQADIQLAIKSADKFQQAADALAPRGEAGQAQEAGGRGDDSRPRRTAWWCTQPAPAELARRLALRGGAEGLPAGGTDHPAGHVGHGRRGAGARGPGRAGGTGPGGDGEDRRVLRANVHRLGGQHRRDGRVAGRWMDPNRREYTIKIALDKPDEG
jgi:hypothetical protein